MHNSTAKEDFAPNSAIIFLKNHSRPFRVIDGDKWGWAGHGTKSLVSRNAGNIYQLEFATGYDPMVLTRYQDYGMSIDFSNSRLLNLLNIKYIVTNSSDITHKETDGVPFSVFDKPAVVGGAGSQEVTFYPGSGLSADGLALASHLLGGTNVKLEETIAQVEVIDLEGGSFSFPVRVGLETAEGQATASEVSGIKIAFDRAGNHSYLAKFDFKKVTKLSSLKIKSIKGVLVIDALTLTNSQNNRYQTVDTHPYPKVFEEGKVSVYENKDVYPRAFWVGKYEIWPEDKVLPRLQSRDFDPQKTVILEENPGVELSSTQKTSPAKVEITSYQNEKITLSVNAPADGFLVLSEIYYPGWKAKVDGKEEKIYQADYILRAVYLPKGTHQVEFVFDPQSLKWGALISLAALLAVLALGFLQSWRWWRKRRRLPRRLPPAASSQ